MYMLIPQQGYFVIHVTSIRWVILYFQKSNGENLIESNQLMDDNHRLEHLSAIILRGFYGACDQIAFVVY